MYQFKSIKLCADIEKEARSIALLNVVRKCSAMNGKIAKKLQSGIAGSGFVLALSPDAYAEKDALISVTASSNSDAQARHF